MKKITAIFCSAVMLLSGTAAFTACSDDEDSVVDNRTMTVMNLSLNPEVEFVLDVDGTVVSVNALNEEGNLIISAEAFNGVEGKTAEEAATLFVEVSKETGYLVSGTVNAGENQLSVSLSGDTAQAEALYNEIKTEVTSYLQEIDVEATISQAAAITEAELKALVAECAPYVETAQMEYAELVNTLVESRKETAEFYSQELKTAYYEAKAFVMEQAEFEALGAHLNSVQKLVFDGLMGVYELAIQSVETTRKALLVDENSIYQLALAKFREAKVDYLNYRNEISIGSLQITVDVSAQLENYKQLVADAEAAILQAGVEANEALDELKEAITENHKKIMDIFEDESIKANAFITEISAKQQEAKAAFFTNFEKDYASAVAAAEENWANMSNKLQGIQAE